MILATKRKDVSQPDAKIMAQIQALKEMYGIKNRPWNCCYKISCQSKILVANARKVSGCIKL